MGSTHPLIYKLCILLSGAILLSTQTGCQTQAASQITQPITPTAVEATVTPQPPTPTPEPMAAVVNGEGITIEEFNAELTRYQAAASTTTSLTIDEQKELVINDLVAQVLLSQEAAKDGYELDDEELDNRLNDIAEQIGGQDSLSTWETTQGYTQDQLRSSLARSTAAAWERDQIQASVPETAEQVHARQIIVYNQTDAEAALSRVNNGEDFETLAFKYDSTTGGDLGWFPRGYLTSIEVEDAAFSLQAGETSGIVQSSIGYHIIQVIDRETDRTLSPEVRLVLQETALQSWISDARSQATIEITLP